jgi:hypothetical protein
VLEEHVRRFDTRIAIVTFGASTGAIAVARLEMRDVLGSSRLCSQFATRSLREFIFDVLLQHL